MQVNYDRSSFIHSTRTLISRIYPQNKTEALILGGQVGLGYMGGYLGVSIGIGTFIAFKLLSETRPNGDQTRKVSTFSSSKVKPIAVVIHPDPRTDRYGVLSRSLLSDHQNAKISKTHQVFHHTIVSKESLKQVLDKTAKQAKRPIDLLILKGHGCSEAIQFGIGAEGVYHESDVRTDDFAALSKRATIIFDSCSTGQKLAPKIASICSQMRIIAPLIPCDKITSYLQHCPNHGWEKGFIKKNVQQMRIFEDKAICRPCDLGTDPFADKINFLTLKAENGNAEAQNDLGDLYRNLSTSDSHTEKYHKLAAEQYYKLAAEQGNKRALMSLALMYSKGDGVPKSLEKSFEYLKLAADQGDDCAQHFVARDFERGSGTVQSYDQAAHYYWLAANQGNAEALFGLGNLYEKGLGVPQDYSQAESYYYYAAKQGNDKAIYALGYLYEMGMGVSQNWKIAEKLYKSAAQLGNNKAIVRGAILKAKCLFTQLIGV